MTLWLNEPTIREQIRIDCTVERVEANEPDEVRFKVKPESDEVILSNHEMESISRFLSSIRGTKFEIRNGEIYISGPKNAYKKP